MTRSAFPLGGLCNDDSCTCRGTGVLSIEQLQGEYDIELAQADALQETDEDRVDLQAKAWARLRVEGLSESELREAAGK